MGKAVPKKPSPDGNTEQTQQSQTLVHQTDFHPPQPPPPQQQQFYSFQHHQEMPGAPFPQAAQETASQPQQQQLPRQILLQTNQQNQQNFQPPQQQQQQYHGGFVDQEMFENQLLESFLDSMGTIQTQGKQHQQQYLPQQQQQLQDQSQQPQQHLMMQPYPPLPHNQSFDPATPNTPVSTQLPGYQLMTSGMGRTGGSISLSPAKLGYGIGLRDEGQAMLTLPSDTSLEPHCGKRQRLDPPVAAYPERSRLDRGSQFNVDIPGTGPKLLVNQDEDGEGRRINTEMGHMITLELTHNVIPSCANFRFLLVYSKDAEASTPVEPCGNHRRQEHPKHMLEVKAGEREASISWEDDPHPSVLVKPTNQAPGRFTCQLAFLCRNSCVTRRDLTLLCQLEVGGRVMGREPFKVKVSACPRRDAGAPTRKCTSNTAPRSLSGTTALSSAASCMFPHPQVLPPDPERVLAADEMAREALGEADRIGKAMFVERYVKQNYPEKYEEAEKVYEHCQRTNGKHM